MPCESVHCKPEFCLPAYVVLDRIQRALGADDAVAADRKRVLSQQFHSDVRLLISTRGCVSKDTDHACPEFLFYLSNSLRSCGSKKDIGWLAHEDDVLGYLAEIERKAAEESLHLG